MSLIVAEFSHVAVGKEVTYDTAVTRTRFFPVKSHALRRVIGRTRRSVLPYRGSSTNGRSFVDTTDYVQGSIVFEPTYEGFGMLLEAWLGGAPSTTGVSSPYTHTYGIDQAADKDNSYSVEQTLGDSGDMELASGTIISKGTLSWDLAGNGTFSADMVARTMADPAANTSTSWSGSELLTIPFDDVQSATWNSVDVMADLRKITVTVDKHLAPRTGFGSLKTKRPARSAPLDVTIQLELEWDDAHVFRAGRNDGTISDFEIVFTDGTRTLTLTGADAFVESLSDPISSMGPVVQSVTLRCQAKTGNEGLKLVLVNTQSSATAA